jgi:hypothetical protein
MQKQLIQQKQGNLITTIQLLDFIKQNTTQINNIGLFDINDIKKEIIENNFSQSLNILKFQEIKTVSYLPSFLNDFFDLQNEKYLYSGVLKKLNVNKSFYKTNKNTNTLNVSFYSSIFSCLKSSFLTQPIHEQTEFILKFIDRIKIESFSSYDKFKYKLFKWNKNDLKNDIENEKIVKSLIKYVADYLHINIFILDIASDELHFSNGEIFIPYKKNLFLIRHDNENFEPLFSEQSSFFSFENKIIHKILINIKNIIPYNFTSENNLNIITNEDINQYLLKIGSISLQEKKLVNFSKKDNDNIIEHSSVSNNKNELNEKDTNSICDFTETLLQDIILPIEDTIVYNNAKDIEKKTIWITKNNPALNTIPVSNTIPDSNTNIKIIVNDKMKLEYLQTCAKSFNISLFVQNKNNKDIKKTKAQLIDEINKLQNI